MKQIKISLLYAFVLILSNTNAMDKIFIKFPRSNDGSNIITTLRDSWTESQVVHVIDRAAKVCRVWDIDNGQELESLALPKVCDNMAVCPVRELMAAAFSILDKACYFIEIYDLRSGEKIKKIKLPSYCEQEPTHLTFNYAGTMLLYSVGDYLGFYNFKTNNNTLLVLADGIQIKALFYDRREIKYATNRGLLIYHTVMRGYASLKERNASSLVVWNHSHKEKIACTTSQGKIKIFYPHENRDPQEICINCCGAGTRALGFNKDGMILAIGIGTYIRFLDTETGFESYSSLNALRVQDQNSDLRLKVLTNGMSTGAQNMLSADVSIKCNAAKKMRIYKSLLKFQ